MIETPADVVILDTVTGGASTSSADRAQGTLWEDARIASSGVKMLQSVNAELTRITAG